MTMKVVLLLLSSVFVYTLAGTPSLRRAQGAPAGQVTKLRLVNADTNQPIKGFDPLFATTVIDLATMPTSNLTIEAITNGTVRSVQWSYDGVTRNINNPAWVMCGKSGTDFNRCQKFQKGKNITIVATPYSGKNATGSAGRTHSVRIILVKSGPIIPLPPTPVVTTQAPAITPTTAPVVEASLGTALRSFVSTTPTKLDLANGTTVEFLLTLFDGTASLKHFVVSAEDSQGQRVEDYEVTSTPVVGTQSYSVRLDFPRFSLPGNYSLSIKLVDANYNPTVIDSTALANLGFPSYIEVVQTTLDVTAPSLLRLTVSPTVVVAATTSSSTYIAMHAAMIDHQSGLGYTELVITHTASGKKWYKNPRGDYFPLVNETFDLGVSFLVTKDTLRGNYTMAIYIRDESRNEVTIGSSELIARGFPGQFTVV